MKRFTITLTMGSFLVFALLTSANAVSIIDTTVGGFSGGVSSFGEPTTATYGQTFTVTGTETVLDSFSMWLYNRATTGTVDFAGYIGTWDGAKMGSLLYYSSQQTIMPNTGSTEFFFTTSGLQLVSGQEYVAFLSASKYFDGTTGTRSMPIGNASYAGGYMVWDNNGNNFNELFHNTWDQSRYPGDEDFAFKASFSPVPEPTTMLLMDLA